MISLPGQWLNHWKGKDPFEELFSLKGRVYRDQDCRKTLRFIFDHKPYFIKLHSGIGWKEIIKNLMQLKFPVTGAQNEWLAIRRLEKLGVNTMCLVGYGKKGINPARIKSFVITKEISNTVSLEELCDRWRSFPPDYSLKRAIITEVAKIAGTIHADGLNHRDFYICHFLLNISDGIENINATKLRLYLIDLHRTQIRTRIPVRWRVKDIAGLYFSSRDAGLTKRDLLRFARVYSNTALKTTLSKDKKFWKKVITRGDSLYAKIHKAT